jgi:thiamine-monophosphate kinase
MRPSEVQLIEKIKKKAAGGRRTGLTLGIGDDCAIFTPRVGEELLLTTDLLIDGVHFHRDTHTASQIGYKTLARGLSDVAAMGGSPRFCLLSLALPEWADARWVNRFYDGLLKLARASGAPLAGGDLARAERLTCDIVVCGAVPKGSALRRDGARPGDDLYVSGALGGSALGLETQKGRAWMRHVHPEPRLALGNFLRTRLKARAAMDLSDGLSLDLRRMCLASRVSAAIAMPPKLAGATDDQALHGGEDYELLFTVSAATRVPSEFDGVSLTRIGTITKGRAGSILLNGRALKPLGYDHFAKR